MKKRGMLRVVEAVVAVVIVLAALLLIAQQRTDPFSKDFSDISYPLLDEFAKNGSLREEVLNYDPSSPNITNEVLRFFQENVNNKAFGYSVEICEPFGQNCTQVEFDDTCSGDANLDRNVDPADLGFIIARLGCGVGTGDPLCDQADVNGDGLVNPQDTGFTQARLGKTCGDIIETQYPPENVEIYVAQRIISTTLIRSEFSPKKIKVWLWVN